MCALMPQTPYVCDEQQAQDGCPTERDASGQGCTLCYTAAHGVGIRATLTGCGNDSLAICMHVVNHSYKAMRMVFFNMPQL